MSSSEPQPEAVQDTVTIPKEEYDSLLLDRRLLDAMRRVISNEGHLAGDTETIARYWV